MVRSPRPVRPKNWPRTSAAPAAELARAQVLNGEVDQGRRVLDDHLADHLAARLAGRAERKPDIVAGQVAGQQQIALGLVAVEHLPLGQLPEIAGDRPLGPAGVAAHAQADELRHQHLEADGAVGDALLGHLDRGDIAGLAQDGGGAIADLADDRDRMLLADKGRESRAKRLGRQAAQIVELDVAQGEADIAIFGAIERARRAFDVAFDGEARARLFRTLRRGARDLFAGRRQRRHDLRLGHGRQEEGAARGQRPFQAAKAAFRECRRVCEMRPGVAHNSASLPPARPFSTPCTHLLHSKIGRKRNRPDSLSSRPQVGIRGRGHAAGRSGAKASARGDDRPGYRRPGRARRRHRYRCARRNARRSAIGSIPR